MKLTPRGWACLILGLVWTAAALAIGEHDMTWPGLFLALLPVVSLLGMLPALASWRLERQLPKGLTPAGEPVELTYIAQLPGLLGGCHAEIIEEVPPALGGTWEFSIALKAQKNILRLSAQVLPRWRGRHLIGPATLRVHNAFGMAQVQRAFPGQSMLVVTPRVYPLTRIHDLDGGSAGIQTPVNRIGNLGVDDALIREYRSGDDTRRIHWRSSARYGELMVRREEQAWDPAATILIDSRLTAYAEPENDLRFEAAVSLAASIGSHLFSEGWRLTVTGSAGEIVEWTAHGHEHEREFLLWLTDLTVSDAAKMSQLPEAHSGELLMAIIGQLTHQDALELARAHRGRRNCWAIIVDGPQALDADALAVLRGADWRVQSIQADTPVASAWHSFETSQP